MVTDGVGWHSAFGVRVRQHGALRGALLDCDRHPHEMHGLVRADDVSMVLDLNRLKGLCS